MDGLLVIDKPAGPTSHDVVARMRAVLGERRIGHTGTLDPAASGVLPLVVGRATRLARFLSAGDKRYEAVVSLGVATDTYDAEGTPIRQPAPGLMPTRADIDAALDWFRGTQLQRPPAFSAKKIGGRPSYESARARRAASACAEPTALPAPVTVTVHRLNLVDVDRNLVMLAIECSSGFYVRSLAHDLGVRLGVGAHLAGLRRTSCASLTLAEAVAFDVAARSREQAVAAVVPLDRMLPGLSSVVLTDEGVRRVTHGLDVGAEDVATSALGAGPPIRLMDRRGALVGIAEPAATAGFLHPSVVLR